MEHKPAISIIMPVYNAEKVLPETVESILAQTFEDFELVCADDNSADGSLALLREFAAKDPRVKVLELEKNGGPAYARKKGLQASKGEFVMFIDDDDLLFPYSCERALSAIREHNCDMLHFNLLMLREDGSMLDPVPFMHPRPGRREGKSLVDVCFGSDLLEEQIDHILWDKIYRGDPCRKAAKAMSENVCNAPSDDYYTFLCIAFFCKSYCGLPDEKLYIHRDYVGYSTSTRVLDGGKVVTECRNFLIQQKALDAHRASLRHIENRIYGNAVESLLRRRGLDRATLEYAAEKWGSRILIDFFDQAGFFRLGVDNWYNAAVRLLRIAQAYEATPPESRVPVAPIE